VLILDDIITEEYEKGDIINPCKWKMVPALSIVATRH
jgi:hypothetical protein